MNCSVPHYRTSPNRKGAEERREAKRTKKTAMKTRGPQRTAMTLIEVLLVVAIMAILAGLAIPNANPSILEQLRSAAGIVSADLAYARSQAVTYGSEFQVSFSTADGLYEIQHAGTNPALDDILENPFADESISAGQYRVVLSELPNLGPRVRLAAVCTITAGGALQQSIGDIAFGPLGETVRSLDTRIWLAAGSGSAAKTITVHVNAVTGLATVEPPGAHPLPATLLEEATAGTSEL